MKERGLSRGDSPLQVRLVFRQWMAWGKELNKPKGLGHFSCDTPHRLSRGLGGGCGRLWRSFGWKSPSL